MTDTGPVSGSRVMSTPVHTPGSPSGHGKNAGREADFRTYVHSSNAISILTRNGQVGMTERPMSNNRVIRNPTGRVDMVEKIRPLSGGYCMSTQISGVWTGVDIFAEVIQ